MAKCAICLHRQRDAIELALRLERPVREIARSFDLPLSSITKHREKHTPLRPGAQEAAS